MAFDAKKIIKLSNVQAADSVSPSKQRFFYDAGADAKAAVVGAGFFNAHRKFLQVGDLVEVLAADPGFFVAKITAVPGAGNVTSAALAYV